MASTSAPASFAARARTGLAPVPVPPPRPVTITTTLASAHSWHNCSASSSAAARPTSGSPPAPRPRVSVAPNGTTRPTDRSSSAWTSVFTATNSTPTNSRCAICSTALQPAPPTPKTFSVSSLESMLEAILFWFVMGTLLSLFRVRWDHEPRRHPTSGHPLPHWGRGKGWGRGEGEVHGSLHLFFHRAKQFADLAFNAAEAAATGPPTDLERAEFDQANGGSKFRLVQRRLQSADRTGFAE